MWFIFPGLKMLSWVFPGLANNLGIYVKKAGDSALKPWIQRDGERLTPNPAWFENQIVIAEAPGNKAVGSTDD
jgi:hypothetical protein